MNRTLLSLALLAISHGAFAQQPPNAGALLPSPPAPTVPSAAPQIRIEPRLAPPATGAEQARIRINALRISGAQRYPEAELLALTGFAPGTELTLAELQAMAARITEHYRRNGYFVAQAFLPAQEIRDQVVTIAVSEGRLGQVDLRNRSQLADRVANDQLQGLGAGDLIAASTIESRLLLLSDLPGVNVQSTLVPGAAPGTSDLVVDVTPGALVSGSIDADNAGNRYTGAYRVGATVQVNNPLGLGDVASLRVLTSGKGLRYARAAYQLQAGRGQLGVAYSHLDYELGKEFARLGAHGTAQIASAFGRYPLLRSRNNNVYAQLAFDAKTFQDRVDSAPSVTDRQSRVLMASLYGDHRDGFGSGGVNSYFITATAGELDLQTAAVRAMDAATARTHGSFQKLSFSAMRLQRLGGPFSAYAAVSGQLASRNLDVSEKMQLGGMNAVRAFPEGEAYGDQGYALNLEGRMDLPPLGALPGHAQLIAFVDGGSVTASRNPWAPGNNRRTLSGAGVGVNWAEPGNFLARAFYARGLGNDVATSAPDRSGRFWLQLVKYF